MTLAKRRGFTIVELLVVVVIIAILAVIIVVTYNGMQARARASQATAALNQAKKKLEVHKIENGTYPLTGNLAAAGVNDGSTTYQYDSDGSDYCITATATNVSYYINSSTVATPTQGGCPGHGQSGLAALTNLATNPSLELDSAGWSNRWYGSGGGAGTLALSSQAAQSGSTGYRKTWTVAGGGQDTGMSYRLNGIQVGKTYTFSSYVRSSVATAYKPLLEWYNASATRVGSTVFGSEVSAGANIWQRVSMTQTVPATVSYVIYSWGPYPSSGLPTSSVGQTVDFDSVMIVEGTSLPTYADGSSTNWIWNGIPNASTSTGPAL